VYPSLASGVLPDPAHRVIDILRSSHVRTPCRLSVETIINLSENGVPKKVFLDLLHQGLEELVEPLLEWDGPDAMRNLWGKVCRIGGVMSARRAREEPGLARVKGYSHSENGREEDNSEDEDEIPDTTEEKSSAWWRDEISGCPSSLEETVMCLIDSGFTPQNCHILRRKLEWVIKGHVRNFIKAYRINVPMSASAFLIPGKISGLQVFSTLLIGFIPDTLGILEHGEIFFKHSRSEFQTSDGLGTDVLLGDVLITRYPCKLPTDVQKVCGNIYQPLYIITQCGNSGRQLIN
jgi:RNA-dependent RNA polymerase